MAMQEDRIISTMEGTGKNQEASEQEVQAAFTEFETRIAAIRKELGVGGYIEKAGHLDLVADGRFTIEKRELIGKVGQKRATLYLNDFFSKNSAN